MTILLASGTGLLAYLVDLKVQAEIFDWLYALSGLGILFIWASICLCHIRFRRAWADAGHTLDQLPYRSQAGVIGSYIGLVGNCLVLAAEIWLAISPIETPDSPKTSSAVAKNILLQLMTIPIVVIFYFGHKMWFRTKIIKVEDMDIDTGRSFSRLHNMFAEQQEVRQTWPFWKRLYRSLC
jgi:amino acid transporter